MLSKQNNDHIYPQHSWLCLRELCHRSHLARIFNNVTSKYSPSQKKSVIAVLLCLSFHIPHCELWRTLQPVGTRGLPGNLSALWGTLSDVRDIGLGISLTWACWKIRASVFHLKVRFQKINKPTLHIPPGGMSAVPQVPSPCNIHGQALKLNSG